MRSAVLSPTGIGGAPHPLGTKDGGLEEGRDEKELSEFIIDCESHHPLSGGPKRDNGQAEKVYIKAGRAVYTPLLLDR